MRRALVSCFLVSTLAIGPHAPAVALGFGDTTSPSLLGQPLDFTATVRLAPDETLERGCVTASVRAGDVPVSPDQVRVAVRAGVDAGERLVRVTTSRPIGEPVVTIDIGVGCGARVVRSFVAFLDPPVVQLAQSGRSEVASVPSDSKPIDGRDTVDASVRAPSDAAIPPRRANAPAPERARAARGVAPSVVASAGPDAIARRRGAGRARVAAVAKPRGPRLQLDAPTVLAARRDVPMRDRALASGPPASAASAPPPGTVAAASAPLTVTAGDAPSPTAADAERARLVAQLAQERERLQVLEGDIARLEREGRSMQQTVAALQARLREAEADRAGNPLVFLLAGACVLLLGATALAWKRPLRGRWWEPTQMPPASAAASPSAASAAGAPAQPAVHEVEALEEQPADAPWTYERPRFEPPGESHAADAAPASSIGGLEVTTVLDHALVARMASGDAEPLPPGEPPAAIEALLDIEQQAEFHRVLGQEARILETLAAGLHGPAASSPMPFRHLLTLHRRRGERAAWMRVAEALHARFGGERPAWNDAHDDDSLEAHGALVERLERTWHAPLDAMRAIDELLFPRAGTAPSLLGYRAYADLLLLWSVARELADPDTGVDLLLPMEDASAETQPDVSIIQLSRYGAIEVPFRPALDLDVSEPGPLDSRPSELRKAI